MSQTLLEPATEQGPAGDVPRVLEELTAMLREAGTTLDEQDNVMARLQELKWVNPHLPIGWPVMPKGLLRKLAAYTKKVVRVLLRWYINPIVEQQNTYNEAIADSFALLCQEIARLQARVYELEAKVRDAEDAAYSARSADLR